MYIILVNINIILYIGIIDKNITRLCYNTGRFSSLSKRYKIFQSS